MSPLNLQVSEFSEISRIFPNFSKGLLHLVCLMKTLSPQIFQKIWTLNKQSSWNGLTKNCNINLKKAGGV
jgi:hypothetical protein